VKNGKITKGKNLRNRKSSRGTSGGVGWGTRTMNEEKQEEGRNRGGGVKTMS